MNRKTKSVYVCSSCGESYPKWVGKCESCGSWDTVTEFREPIDVSRTVKSYASSPAGVVSFSIDKAKHAARITCQYDEIDRVLGGGLVRGAVVLLGGDPGIGKSTLLLQLMAHWALQGKKTLYISGEESTEQVSMRAGRLGVSAAPVKMATETSVEAVLAILGRRETRHRGRRFDPDYFHRTARKRARQRFADPRKHGAPSAFAKSNGTALFLIGHVTKEGAIAGPARARTHGRYRAFVRRRHHLSVPYPSGHQEPVRPVWGDRAFAMSDSGLSQVANASEFFCSTGMIPRWVPR
jgi:DNA repair protein RadA/Sms